MKEMEEKIKREQEEKDKAIKDQAERLENERKKQMAELKAAQEQLRITGDKEMQRKLAEERAAFEDRMVQNAYAHIWGDGKGHGN